MQVIRRARSEDSQGIHEAHMRSIHDVCAKDHSPDEIQGWGNRPFNETQRLNAIKNQSVWVVEDHGSIEGYGQLEIYERNGSVLAHVHGLYLTPKAINQNNGKKIVSEMLEEAKKAGAIRIQLESTLTAHAFYKKMGFHDYAPMKTIEVGGSSVRCFPMRMEVTP